MAKRFGVSDDQIEGMKNLRENEGLFDEKEILALRYAEMVSLDSHGIPDSFFNALRESFSDEAIVEITCVIGLFCYFNRFNNALKVDITR